ncbi:nicotinate-nucleotide adenylyltransferase [Petralouisia muris]|uniref:Nicotinate-nucleotide adenylyltransferase n=1 Tax=Petralouisia muris TaxID=3032872 RepID=A0AC61RQ36_9FIRM|nr:adenylyltransferase/cytidyltransferase family protein [Petralouisia muris]TGY91157.1 nicotinate-nucleotide adenylyltransferase [Petralouisia muris]
MKDKTGVIHGRFQMLHKGHMEYLLAGKERCQHLIIGICNPDPILTKYSDANPHRSLPLSNPLTYFERYQMIQGSLLENNISMEEFDIVPFPINYPELLSNYAPKDAKYYMTIYDQWSMDKKAALEEYGYHVEVMWQRTNEQKFTSGTEVRRRMVAGESWHHLVTDFVYRYVKEHKIDIRIRQIAAEEGKSDD